MAMSYFIFFLLYQITPSPYDLSCWWDVKHKRKKNIPDNFQGVTEIVSDGLPKPSRVNIVTKENL